jgi:hypothetical protein
MYWPAFPFASLPNLGRSESGVISVVVITSKVVSKVFMLSTAGSNSAPMSVPLIFVQLARKTTEKTKMDPFNKLLYLT